MYSLSRAWPVGARRPRAGDRAGAAAALARRSRRGAGQLAAGAGRRLLDRRDRDLAGEQLPRRDDGQRRRVDLRPVGRVHRQGHGADASTRATRRRRDRHARARSRTATDDGAAGVRRRTAAGRPLRRRDRRRVRRDWCRACAARWTGAPRLAPQFRARRQARRRRSAGHRPRSPPRSGRADASSGGRERAEELAAFQAEQAAIEAEHEADDAHFTPPEPPPIPRPKRRTDRARCCCSSPASC